MEPVQRIGDHAVIGDGRSAALVSADGSIDWLCWPRFDSPSLFAAILDSRRGGFWRIAPTGPWRAGRSYLQDTNVLSTIFERDGARVRVTDSMSVCSESEKSKRLVPEHELLRVVDCELGQAEMEIHFEPRPDYGRRRVRLRRAGPIGIRLEDGPGLYSLRGDVDLVLGENGSAATIARLKQGDRLRFSLTYDVDGPAVLPPLGRYADETMLRSVAWWREWAARCTYSGPYRAQVLRSLLALKLLSYAPSGAIVAAPTTSLPERMGGDLNWDYRYCWLRDASLTVTVLSDLGYFDEADAFLSWLLHSTRLTRPELQVLYDVYGGLGGREEILDHLDGYRSSKPVRIGNAAAVQLQLDTYGEIVDAVGRMSRRGARIDRDTRRMLRQFGEYVCENWWRADQGIWEQRGAPEEHTHSRLLCWVALDRLLELHDKGALPGLDREKTLQVRDRIRWDIEERCWNPKIAAYTQTAGGATVDASLLLMSWYEFAPPDDSRLARTFARVHERLGASPDLIHRDERSHAAGEGAFGICCFWAAEYLARGGGSLRKAEEYFERLLPYANDIGLYGEEIDPISGEALGNFPQAFTHVGLIGAALALEERRNAEARA